MPSATRSRSTLRQVFENIDTNLYRDGFKSILQLKKIGIDEGQWAALDKQNRKKNCGKLVVEKWYEIWDVLFQAPLVPRAHGTQT
ncbi:hypothetical protein B0T14DRAFT_561873 [Immersiella caudata]|uniref:Uncharacterized protein n=1 Tax=Immersiella caudata TaxID=314043 RepID=A0AA39X2E5_9PEZI|nr:hypothetical protein B0T14DRAFT_561873 [Immersiella caudata]